MNDFHMISLANDILATRRAEADRARLVRSGHADTTTQRPARPTRQPRRSTAALGALFHRVAFL